MKQADGIFDQVRNAPAVDTRLIAGRWHRDRLTLRGVRTEARVFAKAAITPRNRDVRKFLIIGRARSGTTLLTSLLDSHPGVLCDREVLHSNVLFPTRYLENLAAKSTAVAYGAKLLSYQMVQVQRFRDPVAFLSELQDRGFQLIHLHRGTFAQALSLTLAQTSHRYHSRTATKAREAVTLDVEDFLRRVEWNDLLLRYEERCLRDLPHLSLSYEADLMDRHSQSAAANRIFDWIGVPPAPVDSALKKMLPSDPSKVLANYDEILAAIRERDLAHVLEPT